ncbi:MAG: Maf family protein [Candidatus Margulisbacteria bacterium]|jgi:septum formation protein|nr:Maf family protein [Candidatus Margulisiibacteriota bacterium]
MRLVLVSASPRRRALLKKLGLKFSVRRPETPEKIRDAHFKKDLARTALAKINSVPFRPEEALIACDTIVVCRGRVLGKPRGIKQAAEFLRLLSGRRHAVYSCLALKYQHGGPAVVRHKIAVTKVYFRGISPAEIKAYVRSGAPYDKAGGYGIQDSLFARKICGCYYNVMGLPVSVLIDMLKAVKNKEK